MINFNIWFKYARRLVLFAHITVNYTKQLIHDGCNRNNCNTYRKVYCDKF